MAAAAIAANGRGHKGNESIGSCPLAANPATRPGGHTFASARLGWILQAVQAARDAGWEMRVARCGLRDTGHANAALEVLQAKLLLCVESTADSVSRSAVAVGTRWVTSTRKARAAQPSALRHVAHGDAHVCFQRSGIWPVAVRLSLGRGRVPAAGVRGDQGTDQGETTWGPRRG